MSEQKIKDGELAERVGISRVQVLRIRKGENGPSKTTALKLSEVTGLPLAELILNEDAA